MLAEDKLKEAQFFFDKMRRCSRGSTFRYYLSAFVSACRSVTLVLQKDLRAKYGEQFEQWYREQQAKLVSDQTASIVTLCRNVTQKEGSRLPIYTFRSPESERHGEYLEISCDGVDLKRSLKVTYRFPDATATIHVDESRPIEEQVAEKMREMAPDVLARMGELKEKLFDEICGERLVSFSKDESPIPVEIWIEHLQEYVALLSGIVTEAKSIFKG